MNGGDALVDALLALGVDTGFTVPGESFLNVLEALRVKRDSFRLVSTRHESGGAFAAEAYGKLSGRPAAVFVSRGPGATNAAIGIHTARQSSTPLLLFVGHVRTRSKGREAFQEIDHHRMFAPVAKAVMEPESAADIQRVTGQAVHESMAGRPGPVVVVLPRDITEAPVDDALPAARVDTRQPRAPAESIQAALDAVSAAQFPIIIAGEMVSHERAEDVLVEFTEKLAAPVVTAYRQMDVFPNHHPAYAGHLEINRAAFQRDAFARADLVLAIGTRLDGITTEDYSLLRADQRLVHLYPDKEVLERAAADVAIYSDVRSALTSLHRQLDGFSAERQAWRDGLHAAYLDLSSANAEEAHGAVDLSIVVRVIADSVGDEAVLLTDGGSFARWVHRYYRFSRPRRFAGPISGAMGYAVPGAIGAALACPEAPIIAFVGDGGFMMTGQELTTAAQERLNTTIIVCDNQAHGSILYAQWQQFDGDRDYATRLASPDFVAVARAYGVPGWRVERSAEFPAVLQAAMDGDGPSLLHLVTDQRDIVPGGPEDDVV
ncbi:MAG: thiamine pyrophosphate-binding protein [Acidiferrobacterales bacterium]|nr:thiamine pyrophosphate-binding protein [Gammaproteobacteria bacterium]